MAIASESVLQNIREHSLRTLTTATVGTTNLYIDSEIRDANKPIGPEFQKIVAEQRTIVVFVDEAPLANFAHPCRYRLYNAESGEFLREAMAEFPPYEQKPPETLRAFHQPISLTPGPDLVPVRPPFRCMRRVPDGTRYAILYSGMSNKRHANDLEFLYRTLVDEYGFDPANIYVLNYDGTLNTQDGALTTWPGDGAAFHMQVTGPGTKAGFEAAIDDLKNRLTKFDLLLIHTNNHGGNSGAGHSYVCTYPSFGPYFASDFANKIGELPLYRDLIVMMEQCRSGGFSSFVLTESTAVATSIATAVDETHDSYGDQNWNFFARDWISAQARHLPNGAALVSDPDSNGNGAIEAREAFDYANSIHFYLDVPTFSESSPAGGDIRLGQRWFFARLCHPLGRLRDSVTAAFRRMTST